MDRPNIVFYFSDQQRPDTMGCYGQSLPVTPNLDALAAEGTCFTNAFTCQPVCGPARACLQTGRYGTETGCYRNAIALPTRLPTLAQAFGHAGYDTAYIGKWHLATTRPNDADTAGRMPDHETKAVPERYRAGYRYWMASDVLEFTSHGYNGYVFDGNLKRHDFIGYRADCINSYAIDYLHNRPKEKPFFLFVSQLEPHHQNDHGVFEGPDGSRRRFAGYTPPEDLEKGEGDWEKNYPDYLGQCHALDENVGRLIDTLREQGVWENTVLIYASDHGSHFCTRNGEYKRCCHDAAIHIPLVAYGGPFMHRGRISETVSLMDIPKTLLSCAGIEAPASFHGNALTDLFRDDTEWPEHEVFVQISESQVGRALRTERYTYSVRAVADGWRDSCADTYYEEYLYDNQVDPAQKVNLAMAPAYAGIRAQLRERLIRRMTEAGERAPEILPGPFPG